VHHRQAQDEPGFGEGRGEIKAAIEADEIK